MQGTVRRLGRLIARLPAPSRRGPLLLSAACIALAALAVVPAVLLLRDLPPPPVSDDTWERLADVDRCLAQAIYFEARGEPFEGRMAVAQVVLNRVADMRWPADVCAVVFQNEQRRHKCQFSFACDGRSDRPREDEAWASALKLARLLNAGNIRDLTGQATHYHALRVRPFWAAVFTPTVTIGQHRFYRAGS